MLVMMGLEITNMKQAASQRVPRYESCQLGAQISRFHRLCGVKESNG